jgi:hypothetical protein
MGTLNCTGFLQKEPSYAMNPIQNYSYERTHRKNKKQESTPDEIVMQEKKV